MKKLFWMMLAALPMQAMANEEDPIAYKCYYCTPAEMEDVALAQGVGRHYVYDYSDLSIAGFEVAHTGGNLIATPFPVEDWLERQYQGFMALMDPSLGIMLGQLENVELLAPDTDHGRSTQLLWGHHLSALHPKHGIARETVHRFLMTTPEFNFLDTSTTGGRLLKFEHELHTPLSLYAGLHFGRDMVWNDILYSNFQFDRASRRWHHISSFASGPIQQTRIDFAPTEGGRRFSINDHVNVLGNAFIERAAWASVPVHGELPTWRVMFRCERKADDIQCYIE
ncbi:hypothetical protein [Stenotrophomonas sp.]|uniref:hypothetical protein n=1 Tax=Stenotrophomonas sp. TaxID=69392 RepID=UPI0028ABBAA9|nr:hypothetical protein [Stenotrophomonas sp.]